MSPSSRQRRILLLENIHPVGRERLIQAGFHVETENKALTGPELVARAKDFHVLGIRSRTQITAEELKQLPKLTAVGAFCIGTNQIDLEQANLQGAPVFNAPYSNTRSVAELIIGELIVLVRQLGDRSSKAHQGIWDKSADGAHEVRGRTLGIVGYGHIGTQVGILAEAMGLQVLYYDVIKKLPIGNNKPVETLDELLAQSDFVTLHVPELDSTKNLMSRERIFKTKKGCYILNASRGTVVDVAALAEAIKAKHVAGAAVDVFPVEPDSNKEKFISELQGLPNVILTPHIGGSTEEAQANIGFEVAESLIHFLRKGSTLHAVNFPQLDVPEVNNFRRMINVHKNVPGVLGSINSIVSELGVNIRRQFLSTDQNIGYLIMDMEVEHADKVSDRVKALNTSIRTRVI